MKSSNYTSVEKTTPAEETLFTLSLADIARIVNAFTDTQIPIAAVQEEIQLNHSK